MEKEGMKPGLSERFFATCNNCKHYFEILNKNVKYFKNGYRGEIRCPECGNRISLTKKLDSNIPVNLKRNQKGQLIRRNPKTKSKKQRRKEKKNNGKENSNK